MKSKLIPGGGERQFKTGSSDHGAKASRHSQQEQQRHLQAYLSLRRLRAAVCRRYAALLEGKVFSQRLQQRNESARAKSGSQPEQKQKKLVFSKLQHSDSHMKSLPKTSHYLIFALQKQLAKSGHLKCHRDLEDFYGRIKYNSHPSQLQKSLQDVRRKILEKSSNPDAVTQLKITEKHPCTAVYRGRKDHSSRSRLFKQGSGSGQGAVEPIADGSQKKDETEQMFLKMESLTFATLQPDFMRNFQSELPDLIIPEIPQKSKKAEIYLKSLRRMYDLSISNVASTQRLLDRETDLLYWQGERGVQDLVLPAIESQQVRKRHINRCSVLSETIRTSSK